MGRSYGDDDKTPRTDVPEGASDEPFHGLVHGMGYLLIHPSGLVASPSHDGFVIPSGATRDDGVTR